MSKGRIALFVGLAVLPIVLALWLAGFDVSYQLGNYVVSDNGVVQGEVYHASAPAAGQVSDLFADVGDSVEKGQGVANLLTAAPAALPFGRTSTNVRSPALGTIVHMNVARGQAVAAGQSVATIADLSNLWVVANVDETAFKDVRPGMPVEVKINALDRYFPGQVIGIVPDLANGQAAAPRAATSASAAKPVAQVPVRVAFDYGDAVVYPGMTAAIKIFIR
jgi:multidrug resistance efflux pump